MHGGGRCTPRGHVATRSHALDTATLVREVSGIEPLTLELDQTDQTAIAAGLRVAAETLDPIDVLSNNAGIDEPTEPPVSETSDEIWEETFRVNVTGVFWLCRAAVPLMRDGGSIVNMGSGNGIAPRPNAAAYCASKAACSTSRARSHWNWRHADSRELRLPRRGGHTAHGSVPCARGGSGRDAGGVRKVKSARPYRGSARDSELRTVSRFRGVELRNRSASHRRWRRTRWFLR